LRTPLKARIVNTNEGTVFKIFQFRPVRVILKNYVEPIRSSRVKNEGGNKDENGNFGKLRGAER
jgi:hypothetical protein